MVSSIFFWELFLETQPRTYSSFPSESFVSIQVFILNSFLHLKSTWVFCLLQSYKHLLNYNYDLLKKIYILLNYTFLLYDEISLLPIHKSGSILGFHVFHIPPATLQWILLQKVTLCILHQGVNNQINPVSWPLNHLVHIFKLINLKQ